MPRRISDYREIGWEQLRLVSHYRLVDFAGQVQATFRRSPMLHFGIVWPDERGLIRVGQRRKSFISSPCGVCGAIVPPDEPGLITNPLGLAAVRLSNKLLSGGPRAEEAGDPGGEPAG